VFLLVGDSFLTGKKYQDISEEIKKKVSGEIVFQSFHLFETSLDPILTQSRSLPFLADAQVLRIQNAETLKEKSIETLSHYLEHPSPTSYLIFESDGIEKKADLVELITNKGQVFFLENENRKGGGESWIKDKIRRSGKTISPEALRKIEDQASEAPGFITSVLDQLLLYVGDQKEITEAMVENFEEKWENTDVFSLTDAIAAQRMPQALSLLEKIIGDGDKDLISLLGLLHWQIRRFWQARVLLDEGEPESLILKKCRISFKQAPFFMRQLRTLSREKLEQALEGLFQLDWKVKTGRAEGPLGLEQWVVKTASK
jgi:DNA polymerase III subunit delta